MVSNGVVMEECMDKINNILVLKYELIAAFYIDGWETSDEFSV